MNPLRNFTGAFPVTPPHLLPDNAAQYALDCDVRNNELNPLNGAATVYTALPAGTKGIFTPDGQHIIASQSPMRAYTSPTVDDTKSRVYYTNDEGFRVCQWVNATAAGTAVSSYKVGIPAPESKIIIEKKRKTRWPDYPNTTLKGTFFLEADGVRYQETDVTLSLKSGYLPFSAYTFDSSINAAQTVIEASQTTSSTKTLPSYPTQIMAVYALVETTIGGTTCIADAWTNLSGYTAYLSGATVYFSGPDVGGTATTTNISKVRGIDGVTYLVSGDTTADPTETPSTATPCVEVWLENDDNPGERIWTAYTNNTSSGGIASFPGGAEITLKATGDTTYEVNITYGIIEDRAYVYTMLNEWQEESQPSEPVEIAVSYLDDVVLWINYDACAAQLEGYVGLDHVQFYCATSGGSYIAINTTPQSATTAVDSIVELYHRLFWREPDAEGLAFWTAQYESGVSISEIAQRMMMAAEYANYDNYCIVEDLYVELTGHASDYDGFKYWIGRLEAGDSLLAVIKDFIYASGTLTAHPVPAQINWYYQTFMERDADASGLAYWTTRTTADPYALAEMLYIMLKSDEYKELNKVRHLTQILNLMFDNNIPAGELDEAIAKYDAGQSYNAIAMTTDTDNTVAYVDEGTNRAKGWTLPSLTWTTPPADLELLTMLPNGVFAAKRGNYVYFSEPYLPFAWPAAYYQTIPSDVVGLMPFAGSLLVTTKASPFAISGAHPGGMTQQQIGSAEAGISPYSMTVVAGKPAYACKDGIVVIDGLSGSLDISHQFWTSETWRAKYGSRLSSIKLLAHDGKLIALFDSGEGFIINFNTAQPHLIEYSQTGGYQFSIPGEETLYIATGTSNLKLMYGDPMEYVWWSKEFTFPFPTNQAIVKMVADGDATVYFYGDETLLHTADITSSSLTRHVFRLPSGTRYDRFSFAIVGSARVQEIHVAGSAGELQRG